VATRELGGPGSLNRPNPWFLRRWVSRNPVAFQSSGVSVMAQKLAENLTHTSDSLQLRMMMLSPGWQTTEPCGAYANNNKYNYTTP